MPLEKPGKGPVHDVGLPRKLGRTPSQNHTHPPAQGAHTDQILAEFGYSGAEIRFFRKRQII